MNINRRGFIGAMMASAAALAVGPAAAEEEFQDLRVDRWYIWRAKDGDCCSESVSGRDVINSLVNLMDHAGFLVKNPLLSIDDVGVCFEEYRNPDVIGEFYRCERKIPVTGKWLEELYRRHKHDMEKA